MIFIFDNHNSNYAQPAFQFYLFYLHLHLVSGTKTQFSTDSLKFTKDFAQYMIEFSANKNRLPNTCATLKTVERKCDCRLL